MSSSFMDHYFASVMATVVIDGRRQSIWPFIYFLLSSSSSYSAKRAIDVHLQKWVLPPPPKNEIPDSGFPFESPLVSVKPMQTLFRENGGYISTLPLFFRSITILSQKLCLQPMSRHILNSQQPSNDDHTYNRLTIWCRSISTVWETEEECLDNDVEAVRVRVVEGWRIKITLVFGCYRLGLDSPGRDF